jgi:ferrous iron transport protein B
MSSRFLNAHSVSGDSKITALTLALVGLPNCGKTSLFNSLTGSRQKVANYPGVTVERKEGWVQMAPGNAQNALRLLDLPGTYSLDARTPDEEITRDVVLGLHSSGQQPDVLVAVADATNLERNLGLILELSELGLPLVLALNMTDLAARRGLELDLSVLGTELGIEVIPTVAVKGQGLEELLSKALNAYSAHSGASKRSWKKPASQEVRARFARVDEILGRAVKRKPLPPAASQAIDRVVLHPVWGMIILVAALALMFQAIFSWASVPADAIEAGVSQFGQWVSASMPDGPLESLLVDGVIAGVGSVFVFLPQILILFAFIIALEDSGYLARAAFLMDRVMSAVGLHGRAFIPLLSSYACAIPGIMATRTIANPRDRIATILVAPLTTCSARLPVYTLLVGAFVPDQRVLGFFGLQGLVLFALYLAGTLAPLGVAFVFRRTLLKGPRPALLLELPTFKSPSIRGLVLGLLERSKLFLRRAGTVILSLSVLIWVLSTYPRSHGSGASGTGAPAIHSSYAGRIGHAIEPLLRPLGFDWRVGVALVPGFAAREVMVSALGTVYAVEADASGQGSGSEQGETAPEALLGAQLAQTWSLATGLSLLVWYIFAPQCLSTVAVVRRETNSWKWAGFLVLYMTALAYLASFATYQGLRLLGWG